MKKSPFVFITVSVLFSLNSCNQISAYIMAKPEKTTIAIWKEDNYKVQIERAIGWSGPHYYQCNVKTKKLGGLYWKTIINKSFSREQYDSCVLLLPYRTDQLKIDVCTKKTEKL